MPRIRSIEEFETAEQHEQESLKLIDMAFSNRFRSLFGVEAANEALREAERHAAAARALRELAS